MDMVLVRRDEQWLAQGCSTYPTGSLVALAASSPPVTEIPLVERDDGDSGTRPS
jgi:hypothetical protein